VLETNLKNYNIWEYRLCLINESQLLKLIVYVTMVMVEFSNQNGLHLAIDK